MNLEQSLNTYLHVERFFGKLIVNTALSKNSFMIGLVRLVTFIFEKTFFLVKSFENTNFCRKQTFFQKITISFVY